MGRAGRTAGTPPHYLPAASSADLCQRRGDGLSDADRNRFARGLRLTLSAAASEVRSEVAGDVSEMILSVKGAPPGQLTLRLRDIDAGTALNLVAPWPAKSGLILDPEGNRLDRHQPLAAEALRGWRAVAA